VAKIPKKTKPIDKWYTMNVNIVLTKNYEDQRISDKKTKPIYWTKTLILSEKSMIPNYKKYAKQSQFEN